MSEWRPIESAPKDGTRVLICCGWEPVIIVGYWGKGEGLSGPDCWRVMWDMDEFESAYEATHWMPLPPHPASGAGKEEVGK